MSFTTRRMSEAETMLAHPPVVPHAIGILRLRGDVEMTGSWIWHSEAHLIYVVDNGGMKWIVDADEVVAFSPLVPIP